MLTKLLDTCKILEENKHGLLFIIISL